MFRSSKIAASRHENASIPTVSRASKAQRLRRDWPELEAPYSEMDETRQRRLSIARELITWGVEVPSLLTRLTEASKRSALPVMLQIEFEAMARRITTQFNALDEAADADAADMTAYDQLLENTDRLRELIAAANAALDLIPKV